MLRGLRKASSNWLGKTVMAVVVGFLVISFAIWGIGDIFRGFGRSTLATIGSTEIPIETFRQLYTDRLRQVSQQQFGRPLTLDQARAIGLDQRIVRQIIAEFVLDERARKLKLGVTDAEIARRIQSAPEFQGVDGRFDAQRFQAMIRQAGYTEQRFIAEQRKEMVRRQLTATIVGAPMAPKALLEAADRYQNETRSVDYVLLDRAQAGEIPEPEPEVLAAFYDERKALFRAPEFRKIVIVSLIPAEQAQWISIPEEEVRRAYEERRARYTTAERRHVQQIVFRTMDEARAAAERIAKGEAFEAIAKERGLAEKDFDLGTVTKQSMIDRSVADAAFALKEGETSAPVQGRFGTVLVRVLKVEPERVAPYEEVAAQLKTDLATERARGDILKTYDQMEDERSIGTPLAEAAEKLKLPVRTVETDRSGRDANGFPVNNIPDAQRLLAGAFTAEAGQEIDPLQVDGGYVWYEVNGVTPSRDRTLEEVKDAVEAAWRTEQIATKLRAKAGELIEESKGGKSFAEVAAAAGLTLESKTGIKRGAAAAPLSARGVDTVFRTAKEAVAAADAEQAPEQVVFRVTEIVVPELDPNAEETKQLKEILDASMSDDIFTQYIAQIESEVGVSINQTALRQILSGQRGTDF